MYRICAAVAVCYANENMRKYPNVKFVIDVKKDIENYVLFRRYSPQKFLVMFLPAKLHYVLEGGVSDRDAKRIVDGYVKEQFEKNQAGMVKRVEACERRWKQVEDDYFALIERVFKGYAWPKGKYIGYASVFNMYPRDVHGKTFYFSGLRNDVRFALATTAHELLHFIFYAYIQEKYGIHEDDEFEEKKAEYIWNISETFNLVIETWEPYQKVFKTVGNPYDPAHAKMFPKMKKLWDTKEDIDQVLDYYMKDLQKSKKTSKRI